MLSADWSSQTVLRKRNFRRRAPERYFFRSRGGDAFSAVRLVQRFNPRRRKLGSRPKVSQTLVNEKIQSRSSAPLIQECASSKCLRFRPAQGRGFVDRQDTASSRKAAMSLGSGSANWVFRIVA